VGNRVEKTYWRCERDRHQGAKRQPEVPTIFVSRKGLAQFVEESGFLLGGGVTRKNKPRQFPIFILHLISPAQDF
jgi:hypothetical protein